MHVVKFNGRFQGDAHTYCVGRLDRCPPCCVLEEHGGMNVGMFEKMWVVVFGERAHFFVQKDDSLQVRMLGTENELLFYGSECASGLSCICVVKVEGALQFLRGGKLFSILHNVCGENRLF